MIASMHLYLHRVEEEGDAEDGKGRRRMPWHRKPTKGAASRDSPRGGAHGLRSGGTRMGEPDGREPVSPQLNT